MSNKKEKRQRKRAREKPHGVRSNLNDHSVLLWHVLRKRERTVMPNTNNRVGAALSEMTLGTSAIEAVSLFIDNFSKKRYSYTVQAWDKPLICFAINIQRMFQNFTI